MREKEMGESERKAMTRQLEKQGKAVERAAEVEKQLYSQVVRHFRFYFVRMVVTVACKGGPREDERHESEGDRQRGQADQGARGRPFKVASLSGSGEETGGRGTQTRFVTFQLMLVAHLANTGLCFCERTRCLHA